MAMVLDGTCRNCEETLRQNFGGHRVYIPLRRNVDRSAVRKLRRQGLSLEAIARRVGRTPQRVGQILAKARA